MPTRPVAFRAQTCAFSDALTPLFSRGQWDGLLLSLPRGARALAPPIPGQRSALADNRFIRALSSHRVPSRFVNVSLVLFVGLLGGTAI